MTRLFLARRFGGACALLLAALPAAQAQSAAASSHPVTFRIVHGIPAADLDNFRLDPTLPVDVLVDKTICLAKGITFGSVSGPYTVPPGTYTVQISLANTLTPCGNAPVITKSLDLISGANEALVAAFAPSGALTIDQVPLNFATVGNGTARFIVAHTALAPAVAVSVNGKVAIPDLKPQQTVNAALPSGTAYTITVSPAGSKTVVIGPLTVTPPKRSVEAIFAVGDAASGSITAITTQILDVF